MKCNALCSLQPFQTFARSHRPRLRPHINPQINKHTLWHLSMLSLLWIYIKKNEPSYLKIKFKWTMSVCFLSRFSSFLHSPRTCMWGGIFFFVCRCECECEWLFVSMWPCDQLATSPYDGWQRLQQTTKTLSSGISRRWNWMHRRMDINCWF